MHGRRRFLGLIPLPQVDGWAIPNSGSMQFAPCAGRSLLC